jgi:uncharacterized RDD family membrane protein YckC
LALHQNQKVDIARRIVATAADYALAIGLFFLIAILSGRTLASLVTAVLFLYRDAPGHFFGGTSPGKFLLSMKVVGDRGQDCDRTNSFKRNLTMASFFISLGLLTPLFHISPWLRGPHALLPALAIGLVFLALETYKLLTDEKQSRIGDLLAGTKVVDRHPQPYRPGL